MSSFGRSPHLFFPPSPHHYWPVLLYQAVPNLCSFYPLVPTSLPLVLPSRLLLVTFLSHPHLTLAALFPMQPSSSSSSEVPSTAAYSVAWSSPTHGDRFDRNRAFFKTYYRKRALGHLPVNFKYFASQTFTVSYPILHSQAAPGEQLL